MLLNLDYSILKTIHKGRVQGFDPVLQFISEYTSFFTIGLVILIVAYGTLTKNKALVIKGFGISVLIFFNALLIYILKISFERIRPFNTHTEIVKLTSGGSYSFPSGHTAEVFALAFAMLFIFKNKIAFYIFITWALIIAYSRMALGVHYPFDIISGAVIGSMFAYFYSLIFNIKLSDWTQKK